MSVIHFDSSGSSGQAVRKNFIYKIKTEKITTIDGDTIDFPCIGLYHSEDEFPVAHPGYERWLFDLRKSEGQKSETLRGKAYHLCAFLNYILWNTRIDCIADVTINDFRDFMVWYKEKDTGETRDPKEWSRGIGDVAGFLARYIQENEGIFDFSLKPEDIITRTVVRDKETQKKYVITETNKMSVRSPVKCSKKYRLLLHGHLEMLIYEARKYDPMIAFAVMLQAYGGLREGEVMNLTCASISKIYGGFGRIIKIAIDLTCEAAFWKKYTGKTTPASIKKYRTQEVYPDFIDNVMKGLEEHERILDRLGYSQTGEGPLFVDRHGKPMTVATYTGRLRKLFRGHFIPDLRKYCISEGTMADNAPYIDAYERNYPGAHMLRHWYTMYLLQHTDLTADEVSKWRGDSSTESMREYIHANADLIHTYKCSVFAFQRWVLEESKDTSDAFPTNRKVLQ